MQLLLFEWEGPFAAKCYSYNPISFVIISGVICPREALNNSLLFSTVPNSSEILAHFDFYLPIIAQMGFDQVFCPYSGQTYPV